VPKKIEKSAVSPSGISSPSYIPSVQWSVTQEDPQVLELEIAAVAKNTLLKNHAVAADEAMPGDLAVTRMEGVMDRDKYTMMIGSDKRIVLGINAGTTTLEIHHKSADPLNGFLGDGETNIVWEDVKAIHISEMDTQTGTPSTTYLFGLISDGAKYPLIIQCHSPEDLQHLVSTMEYFIRNSRLGHDTPLTGMPFPNQGLVLNNDCVVEKLWADSPMANAVSSIETAQPNHVAQLEASQQVKRGVQLGDMIWSVDKNAGLPPQLKSLETQLSALTSGPHNLFVVSPEDREKGIILMNQTHTSYFNPKRKKITLTLS
jgi:hypothetical protein